LPQGGAWEDVLRTLREIESAAHNADNHPGIHGSTAYSRLTTWGVRRTRFGCGGPASSIGNTGGSLMAGNSVNGSLSPSGGNHAPIDGGEPNTSNGPATNQCTDLT
jgi:hypothetical protein